MFNVLNFDLKNNFNTFRKLFYNNLNNHYVKLFQIFPNIDSWLKTYVNFYLIQNFFNDLNLSTKNHDFYALVYYKC